MYKQSGCAAPIALDPGVLIYGHMTKGRLCAVRDSEPMLVRYMPYTACNWLTVSDPEIDSPIPALARNPDLLIRSGWGFSISSRRCLSSRLVAKTC